MMAVMVVLVVASDDGIMPQTIEAINHAKSAEVPIVVAINKCDLLDANPALVKADLTKYEIIAEDLGGDIPVVEISALKGDGIDDLLETLSLVAEIEELKSVYESNASGYIIESRMEIGKGNVATVIVTRGTLNQGDFLYAGGAFCRIKSMFDHSNKIMNAATMRTILIMPTMLMPTKKLVLYNMLSQHSEHYIMISEIGRASCRERV